MFGFINRRKRRNPAKPEPAAPARKAVARSEPEDTGQDDDIRGGPAVPEPETGWDEPLPVPGSSPAGDAAETDGSPLEDVEGETVPQPGSAVAPAGAGRASAPASGLPDDGTEADAPPMGGPEEEGLPGMPGEDGPPGVPAEEEGQPDGTAEAGPPGVPDCAGAYGCSEDTGGPGDVPEEYGDGGPDEDDPDGVNSAVDAMAGAGSGPGRKRRKAARPEKAAKTRGTGPGDRNGPGDRQGRGGGPWSAMDETRRQMVFTCGCVTAGFCAIVLVIFGTAFVCRMFSAQPRPAIAMPDQEGNVYYDAGGRMHVNVYMSQQPDTEITVYVLPDGTVTTEKPDESQAGVRTVVLYVDEEGNLSETPPGQQASSGGQRDESPVQSSQVLYLDDEGNLTAEKPSEGSWRPVTVILGRDGSVSVVPGEIRNAETEVPDTGADPGDQEQAGQAAEIPPLVLYIGTDGSVSTEKPGDGEFRKYTVDMNGGTPSVVPESAAPAASEITEVPGTWDDSGDGASAGTSSADVQAPGTEPEEAAASGEAPEGGSEGTYTIRHGDTLTGIARRLGFTVDFLAEYNQIANKNLIITGDMIRYPL